MSLRMQGGRAGGEMHMLQTRNELRPIFLILFTQAQDVCTGDLSSNSSSVAAAAGCSLMNGPHCQAIWVGIIAKPMGPQDMSVLWWKERSLGVPKHVPYY